MPVTIYDVAREAGVSMATVSRVVNGNPNVKPSTRKKVLRVIEELGYRPNAVARGLASKKTTTVGVVIPDISNPLFAELARGIDDIANMYHYNIILCDSDQNVNKEISLINTLLEKQVDGLVFLGGVITSEHIQTFATASIPIVLAATRDDEEKWPSVNIDHYQAAYDATCWFIENGHTRIAMITGPMEHPLRGRARYEGYVQALMDAGIPLKEEWVRSSNFRYEQGLKFTNYFLDLDHSLRPTAIFTASDELGIAAIHAIQDRGLRVPEDIEVMGFGNIRLAEMVRPQLSTVVQPIYDIGAVSMRLLTKYMNGEHVEHKTVVLPHRIEVRKSAVKK